MITIEHITGGSHPLLAQYKSIRLAALQETPIAFGSTYANESRMTEVDWQQRAATWATGRATMHLALDNGIACGMAGALIEDAQPPLYFLNSMWIAPTHRRLGIGQMLVAANLSWAAAHGATCMTLHVTNINRSAIAFYEKLGFRVNDKIYPYPNDPALFMHEMEFKITPK